MELTEEQRAEIGRGLLDLTRGWEGLCPSSDLYPVDPLVKDLKLGNVELAQLEAIPENVALDGEWEGLSWLPVGWSGRPKVLNTPVLQVGVVWEFVGGGMCVCRA